MYNPKYKHISLLTTIPWQVLAEYPCEFKEKLLNSAKILWGNDIRISVREFKSSHKCRFVVMFKEQQVEVDAIESAMNKMFNNAVGDIMSKIYTEQQEQQYA